MKSFSYSLASVPILSFLISPTVSDVSSTVSIIGRTGVSAMQLALLDDHRLIILDKAENNALRVNGHAAWGQIYDFKLNKNIPLDLKTNTFCAAGSFLSNGTFISTGGNPAVKKYKSGNGFQSIRIFDSTCKSNCQFYEDGNAIHMTSNRWYPTSVRLPDGGLLIAGGDQTAEFITNASTNNPTYEFFPPRGDGKQIHLQFLVDSLPFNLFPYVQVMRDGRLFFQAKNLAMLYDYTTKTVTKLPDIPPKSVSRSYPQSGAMAMLPLVPEDGYKPTLIACGGSNVTKIHKFSIYAPADNTCAYIKPLDTDPKWKTIKMPSRRVMGEFQHLPDGTLLLLNGAVDGLAGFGNAKAPIGQSNAGTPNLQPVQFFPDTFKFKTKGWKKTKVPRLYHSTAALLPNSTVVVMGSNPNGDVQTRKYPTEYRIELITPPYLLTGKRQPIMTSSLPRNIQYGNSFTMNFDWLPDGIDSSKIRVSIIDTGFATHGVRMDHRAVVLPFTLDLSKKSITATMVKNTRIYPPGPGWIFIMVDGVPIKEAKNIIIGAKGQQPPVDALASKNVQNLEPYPQTENKYANTESHCNQVNQTTCISTTHFHKKRRH